eukprot:TRINITY_DN20847_c0_g1_i1.p1 TRINITY_DN20847_c0_g1~~TRINITY_DN20847_c0_g1_i1.p1  ORF type:complete len:292 (+),score=127.82 TRINITY_DN20847_c0_g1_i1:82-876(+)
MEEEHPPEGEDGEELPADEGPYQPATLVQYDEPIQISEQKDRYPGFAAVVRRQQERTEPNPVIAQGDDILHCILPPRDLGDGWIQHVSSRPATRFDVRDLTEIFEYRLRDSKARESGICPVRSAIYAMCFDELIRQVAVDCAERGLVLLRIRDELRMTSEAYKTLYEASVGFGKKKAVEAEKGKQEMIDRIDQLSQQKQEYVREVKCLQAKLRAMERSCQEQRDAEQKKYSAELQFLQQTNKRLKKQEQHVRDLQEEERRAFQS